MRRSIFLILTAGAMATSCGQGGPRPVARSYRAPAGAVTRLGTAIEDAERRPVRVIADGTAGGEGAETSARVLRLADVLEAMESRFPLILAALEEVDIAEGELLSAMGGFDLRAKAKTNFGVQGFYENETTTAILEQPTEFLGTTLFGGYKLGTGDFPIWEGGLKTREGGEFALGARIPLLAGRAIDSRRLAVWRARVERAQADPLVQSERLDATRRAALAYWRWVGAGQKLEIMRGLLELATTRTADIEFNAQNGTLAPIAVDENERLVVERQAFVIAARRAFEAASIELSLYLRGPDGTPVLPREDQVPTELPSPTNPAGFIADEDVDLALSLRPEIGIRELELEKIALERARAENDALPVLDLGVAGSKDTGDQVSTPDDKGPFEVDAFVQFELPLQRRTARGRVRALDARANKARFELQFARERVAAEVADARSALMASWEQLELARKNLEKARIVEAGERDLLEIGGSDLLRVNIRERQTVTVAGTLVDVIVEHFRALAEYRARLGVGYDAPH